MKYFLMFCAPPRSGHTLVASIINAHPNCIISNQMFILNEAMNKTTFDKIKTMIKNGSRLYGDTRSVTPVPKEEIKVIGDKTGHRTVQYIIDNGYEGLQKLKDIVNMEMKWINVVRNPFDVITTWTLKNRDHLKRKNKQFDINEIYKDVFIKYRNLNKKIAELHKTENILTINHEYVIRRTDRTLKEISKFLDLGQVPNNWKLRVKEVVWPSPNITRTKMKWTPKMKKNVNEIIKKYDWLHGYSYG